MSDKFKSIGNPMRRAIYYDDVEKIEPGLWPFRYFSPDEIKSKGNGGLLIDYQAMAALDAFRHHVGKPIIVSSGYRDPIHNTKVMSQPTSLHRQGRAFDINIRGLDPIETARIARAYGWPGIGLYNSFVHLDDASPRRWGLSF